MNPTTASLRDHLVNSRLAGRVATSPANTLGNCTRLVSGDPGYTFGLSDWRRATFDDAVAAVSLVCGADPQEADDPHGPGWIDPEATLRGLARHHDVLAEVGRNGGARVLLATGHPTGLLAHYIAVARALRAAGSVVLTPLDGATVHEGDDGRRREWRFLDGVGCVSDGASLRHSHHSRYMEAALDAVGGPDGVDLVVGDHGMAGAAIERGIPTLSIADVNDVALPLCQARGRTDAVLPVDDNLPPRLFVPLTEAMLEWAATAVSERERAQARGRA